MMPGPAVSPTQLAKSHKLQAFLHCLSIFNELDFGGRSCGWAAVYAFANPCTSLFMLRHQLSLFEKLTLLLVYNCSSR